MTEKRYDVDKIKVTINGQEIIGYGIKTIPSFCGCCGVETTNRAFFHGSPRDPLCEECAYAWSMPIRDRFDSYLVGAYIWFNREVRKCIEKELFDRDCSLKEIEKLLENQRNKTVEKGLFNASPATGEES